MGFFSNLFKKEKYDDELKVQAKAMNKMAEANNNSFNNPTNSSNFYFQVEDVFTITGRGTVVTGTIVSGSISLGDSVLVNGIKTTIAGIEMFRKQLDHAEAGDNVGIFLQGITRKQVSKGNIITK